MAQTEIHSSDNKAVIDGAAEGHIRLPSADFIKHAEMTQDGQDLVLTAPDGSTITIENYFIADPAPVLSSPDGFALTPQLVNSFVHHTKFAAAGGMHADESPVGAVQEVHGQATVTRTDGTVEPITQGTPIYQGDIIETDCGDCAVNISFIDQSSVVVSENARLAIDEYVFDSSSESGVTNMSILRGLFVFTSGLIGREDPDDVEIRTPQGSIGIRGTIIAGNADTGEITVLEGAIVLTAFNGQQVTLSEKFQTAQFNAEQGGVAETGTMDAKRFTQSYQPVRAVSPQLFSSIDASDDPNVQRTTDPMNDEQQPEGEQAPAADQPQPDQEAAPQQQDGALPPAPPPGDATLLASTRFDGGINANFDTSLKPPPPPSGDTLARTLPPAPPPGDTATINTQPPPPPPGSTITTAPPPPPPPSGTTNPAPTHFVLNLNDLAGAAAKGFFVISDSSDSRFGSSIAALGDYNGDGFADLGITMDLGSAVPAGATHILNGSNTRQANGDRGTETVSHGLAFNTSGSSVDGLNLASVGDFDGDGNLDYIVGAPNANGNGAQTGQIQVFEYNGSFSSILSLTGMVAGDMTGQSVAGIGDINRDGKTDIIVGAPGAGASLDGSAYVIYGGTVSADVSAPSGGNYAISGTTFNRLGQNVSGAGDFNNDGYDDYMFSVPGLGETHIVFGGAGLPAPTLTDSGNVYDTVRIAGINVDPSSHDVPLFDLGDFNGDGVSDIALASTASGAETLYFFFGDDSRTAGNLTVANADFRIMRSGGDTRSILGAGTAGDFNGDGVDDIALVVGDGTKADIYVVYGRDGGATTLFTGDLNNDAIAFHMTYNMTGMVGDDFTITRAGDLDGDGFDDLAIGIPGKDTDSDTLADGSVIGVYGRLASGAPESSAYHIAGKTTASQNVIANANGNHLVGSAAINILDDGGKADVTMSAGAGDDILRLHTMNFDKIDGGTGWDTVEFMMPANSTVDFTSFNAHDIQGIEILKMSAAGNQTMILTMDNIFNMLKMSEKGHLAILGGNQSSNNLQIDLQGGSSYDTITADGHLDTSEVAAALGGSYSGTVTIEGVSTEEFHIAGYTVNIDQALFTNNNVTEIP